MALSSESIAPSTTAPLNSPKTWIWQNLPICYQTQGEQGPAVLLVHGFGASWGHWRKNIPDLATHCRVYAIDLIGFGGSAKPTPGEPIAYTFETWGQQIADFCREVIGEAAFLVGNSIGCVAIMQAAVTYPDMALGVVCLNCSLRLLHDRKRAEIPWYRSLGAGMAQNLLSIRWLGQGFFNLIAKPRTVRNILLQAYHRPEAVTDELIDMLMTPAADTGAADVFIAFTRYSQGPLPEDLLKLLACPTLILWGTEDPWEPIELGRQLAASAGIEDFIPLAGAGHCPQDEAPELVNPILQEWILNQALQLQRS
ncbi:MAG: alpha/beta fold hydrolase [Cyanothece sp. SIO1E1]|nr:alpha/beta fold hydrolase [Cyanothece sp. SIO1E1]